MKDQINKIKKFIADYKPTNGTIVDDEYLRDLNQDLDELQDDLEIVLADGWVDEININEVFEKMEGYLKTKEK